METLEKPAAATEIEHRALRIMFEARKRVFVDLLGWDVPVRAGLYEIDQFDTPAATYVILRDDTGGHRASARLLPTNRPHILADLFPTLCEGPIPRGVSVREITRFCIDPQLTRTERRAARNDLVSSLVDFALFGGIESYTAVASVPWFNQIERFGWQCSSLGPARRLSGELLIGLKIDIDAATVSSLQQTGIYNSADFETQTAMELTL
jgi:N-acyl-L-homoserine lactone synthetase